MQLVIPMAGLGQRFADAGYALPKPLIPVGGLAMVVRVARNLPPADRTVLICHPEHVQRFPLRAELERLIPGAVVVVAPGLTAGQACSTRLASDHLDPDQPVLVAACDSTQVYDAAAWDKLVADPATDAVVWTFRNDPRVLIRPEAWGWVRSDADDVRVVSVKKPISAMPLRDRAVTGTFWFRTAGLMAEGIDGLIALDQRVNNEFYLDSVPNVLIQDGRGVRAFDVDKYIGWGTPDDYEDYLRWERHFRGRQAA
ncbi:NTP transferase domain-containing protein [Limnoglobus roseus]|uniref:Putative glycosyltransferase n=1 Tax=Limnoglobus roseus TaxID=2598579 RepID=A0A5C1AQ79_9BACT|nr:NTP transferase domain-containing protein [Limnoglobus roseus]QEL20186.1 putative glycosyltransferase [Limnoglobus roseus]